jgi:hypothetical protein
MVDYTHNCNYYETLPGITFVMSPGDGYEAPMYSGKQAFNAAITTMKNNHPNDWFTTIAYGNPRENSSDQNSNNQVRCPLGTYYDYASASLFFPFTTINGYGSSGNLSPGTPNYTEVTPYDTDLAVSGLVPSANFTDTIRGYGDTCFAMGLMLAYNQFITTPTSDTTLRTYVSNLEYPPSSGNTSNPIDFLPAMAGGSGRRGAQKVVIFETDGICNHTALPNTASATGPTGLANFSTITNYKPTTYYPIRYDMNNPSGAEYPTTIAPGTQIPPDSRVTNQINNLIVQMNNDYGSTRNPFKLYTLALGPVFATGAPDRQGALQVLQDMQYFASLAPGSASPGSSTLSNGPKWASNGTAITTQTYPYASGSPYPAIQSNQIIIGTDQQMITNMTAAYTSILESGVQIALIK